MFPAHIRVGPALLAFRPTRRVCAAFSGESCIQMAAEEGESYMASTWNALMETGDPLIDAQHRDIVNLLDDLQASHLAPEVAGLRALDKLMDFTVTHFTAEESLMTRVGYPATEIERMVVGHRRFQDHARLRVLEFRMGNTATLLSLHAFLYDWLTEHEFGLDSILVEWIHAQDESSSAG